MFLYSHNYWDAPVSCNYQIILIISQHRIFGVRFYTLSVTSTCYLQARQRQEALSYTENLKNPVYQQFQMFTYYEAGWFVLIWSPHDFRDMCLASVKTQ
jgi:hypothetical protein